MVVYVHAPNEYHSREVLPFFKKLAEELKDVKDLTFGEFDVTENEHDHIKELRFPRLVFYGKDNKHADPPIALEPLADTSKHMNHWKKWLGKHSSAFRSVFPNESDDLMTEL